MLEKNNYFNLGFFELIDTYTHRSEEMHTHTLQQTYIYKYIYVYIYVYKYIMCTMYTSYY